MDAAQINQVIDKLVEAKLVRLTPSDTQGDGQVELVHEALIDNWPRYQGWLEAEQLNRYKRLRLVRDAQDWQAQDRPSDLLWRGQVLQEAKSYQNLSVIETEFLEASENALKAATFQEENFLIRLEFLTKELEVARTNERALQEELNTIQATSKLQEEALQERISSFESDARGRKLVLQKRVDSLETSLKAQEKTLQDKVNSHKAASAEVLRYKQKYQRFLIITAFLVISTGAAIAFAVVQRQNSSSQSESILRDLTDPPQSEIARL
ncbi:hypothetical protein VB780_03190 [Leptolyngbya sp. CCNP1308]|uniref:nSTAND1 domain-containing NTPase n=1 Tax=Leptolyngbya sp. CCNP1308 TaxID=3110255 RepID=UPI002B2025D5|nr:hypothetical protein [Leptolyngbya sp. CCNP1308]MEA5447559.1 hypothetical protein [Leptolyngbya sp. CCNP1308]